MNGAWDDLRFFIALARLKLARSAAAQLGVSESTVRRRLAELETQFGATLFERANGVFLLSPEGRQLMAAAEEMEQAVDRVRETLSGSSTDPSGHVRVGAGEGIGSLCIAPLLARLQKRLPKLTIELLTLPRTPDLARHEVDVAVVGMKPEVGGDHRIRSLGYFTLRLYASTTYLSEHAPIRSIEGLDSHRTVGYPESLAFSSAIRQAADIAGMRTAPYFLSSSIIAQARAIAAGAGVGLLPSYAAEQHLNLEPVLHDEISLQFPVWLMVHAGVATSARVRAVADAIASLFPLDNLRSPVADG